MTNGVIKTVVRPKNTGAQGGAKRRSRGRAEGRDGAVIIKKERAEMKDALIKIRSIQREGGVESETEVITAGQFGRIRSGYELRYDETDATGYDGAKTVLKILDGTRIEMTRTGAVESELLIERGRKNFCLYGTPFGEITVGVQGKGLESRMTDAGGTVSASYVIDVNSSLIGDYDLEIQVRARK